MSEITITRSNDYGGRLRRMIIFIDGRQSAALLPKQSSSVVVDESTSHTLVCKMDWVRSSEVVLEAGRPSAVEVSLPFRSILLWFTRPKSAICVTVVESQ
jgi:hypothetical protein